VSASWQWRTLLCELLMKRGKAGIIC
jgi:hypothetical protein